SSDLHQRHQGRQQGSGSYRTAPEPLHLVWQERHQQRQKNNHPQGFHVTFIPKTTIPKTTIPKTTVPRTTVPRTNTPNRYQCPCTNSARAKYGTTTARDHD